MGKKKVTRFEMLLAIAMSEYHQTTHVMFLPVPEPGKVLEYRAMLFNLIRKKEVEVLTENFYKLTDKGRRKLLSYEREKYAAADKAVDDFINRLE